MKDYAILLRLDANTARQLAALSKRQGRSRNNLLGTLIRREAARVSIDGVQLSCGHPVTAIVSGDDGTNYCKMCEYPEGSGPAGEEAK